MKTYRFAFIANSTAIANLVRSLADPERMEVKTYLEAMENALPIAKRLIAGGVDVILGGGATGRLLLGSLGAPVVVIERTSLDILRALIKAKNFGSLIGLTCYAKPPAGLDLFEKLLNIRIRPIPFSSTKELVNGIARAESEGINCIVGGGVCKEIASTHGLDAVVVIPGHEVILQALEEAAAIAAAQRREREKTQRLHIILESINEGVIGIDDRGNIDILNRMAADKLGLDTGKTLGKPLASIVKNTGLLQALRSGKAKVDTIRRIAGENVVISSSPITVGGKIKAAVATFRLASRIQNIDRELKEKLYERGFSPRYRLDDLKGMSPAILRLKAKATRYAGTDAALLIQGETGTGKEILAQSIHALSGRAAKPFVAVNCAALSEPLLESELFGYEEGAFTGAKKGGKVGLFELAHGGTILLDEIADISFRLQVRLLRVLEEKVVMRVGGDRIIPVDVRVISSTHKNLDQEVQCRNFRPDLRYRLAVLHLHIPPLRERKEDVESISRYLLIRHGASPGILSPRTITLLQAYDWPGNVRQLDALLRRYSLLLERADGDEGLLEELLDEMRRSANRDVISPGLQTPSSANLKEALSEFEAEHITSTLQDVAFNKTEAARRLGISVTTLWRKMQSFQGAAHWPVKSS